MYSRTGDKVEPESRPILDKSDPKREERIRVVTENTKGTFENVWFFLFFLFQDLADLSLEGRKWEVGKKRGGGGEEQLSLSTRCAPGHLLSTRACTSPVPLFPTTLEGKGFCSSIT